jgi:hypothetical protein
MPWSLDAPPLPLAVLGMPPEPGAPAVAGEFVVS